jgi:K+-sensing histidine kinase KdpD
MSHRKALWRRHRADLIGATTALEVTKKDPSSLSHDEISTLVANIGQKNKRLALFTTANENRAMYFSERLVGVGLVLSVVSAVISVAFLATILLAPLALPFVVASAGLALSSVLLLGGNIAANTLSLQKNNSQSAKEGEEAKTLFSQQVQNLSDKGLSTHDALSQAIGSILQSYGSPDIKTTPQKDLMPSDNLSASVFMPSKTETAEKTAHNHEHHAPSWKKHIHAPQEKLSFVEMNTMKELPTDTMMR